MTNQEIADKIKLPVIKHREYPTSVAQDKVIAALGISRKLTGHTQAGVFLKELGLVVTSRRDGRTHTPVVILIEEGGHMNQFGEGEDDGVRKSDKLDLSGIRQWIKE